MIEDVNNKLALVSNYESILGKIDSKHLGIFISVFVQLRMAGVEDIAYRHIDQRGNSQVFSTNIFWHKIDKDESFMKDQTDHICAELLTAEQRGHSIVTRSCDKVFSPYLRRLNDGGTNNSIIIYRIDEKETDALYLMGTHEKPEMRDLLLNNWKEVSLLSEKLQPVWRKISSLPQFNSNNPNNGLRMHQATIHINLGFGSFD